MKVQLNPCYILHQKPYKESSLLLDVFSRDYGRLSLVARGVRKNHKENKYAILQPYQLLQLSWFGRTDLSTLIKMELESVSLSVHSDSFLCGFYLNELLVRLLHRHEPHQYLFDSYQQTLCALDSEEAEEQLLRKFEKKLLETLGYGIALECDVQTGEEIKPNHTYYYLKNQGPCYQNSEHQDGISIKGSTLIDIKTESFSDRVTLKESKKLMRFLLKSLLGSKPLASRELFIQHSIHKALK